MLKIVLIIVGVVLALGVGVLLMIMKGPDLSKYEYLKEPKINDLPNVTVLEVPFEVSSEGLKDVFGFLFKVYFKMKAVPKSPGKLAPPAARYENAIDFEMEKTKREEAMKNIVWKGTAAIPIPDEITELPKVSHQDLTPGIITWQYGKTAEILHIGPYEKEPPTVQKLKIFIQEQGYEIAGIHEEVYLRGPGSLFSKPENYYTIIRYPVKKK